MIVSLSARISVAIEDITYLEGFGNYTKVVLTNGSQLIVTLTLSTVLQNITSDNLLRVSKTYAIHVDSLTTLHYDGQKAMILPNGKQLTISRRRLRILRREMNLFRKEGIQHRCA